MYQQFNGPAFMQPHFYPCPQELEALLPKHNVHQGIHCTCDSKHLIIKKRVGTQAIFAHCISCGGEFKIYVNGDYPAGYIPDDPAKPLKSIMCSNCEGHTFQVGVGYEYPGDEIDSTDITWFTMVGKCSSCGTAQELFSDETG
jgi:hypothetical protein